MVVEQAEVERFCSGNHQVCTGDDKLMMGRPLWTAFRNDLRWRLAVPVVLAT